MRSFSLHCRPPSIAAASSRNPQRSTQLTKPRRVVHQRVPNTPGKLRSAHEGIRHSVRCRGSAPEDDEGKSNSDEEPDQASVSSQPLSLSRDVVDRLRSTVFGFDTFFVTSVENYDADGVLFKGNLRGKPEAAQAALKRRLKATLGDEYVVYLLSDQEEKPCVVVFPREAVDAGAPSAAVEAGLAVVLGLATVGFCVVGSSGALTESTEIADPSQLLDGLPGTLALLLLLGAHEAGHLFAAKKHGVELAPPLLVPSNLGFLGSFGAVTRIKSTLKNREQLLEVALAGPAAGAAASLAMLLVGLGLSAAGQGDVTVETSAFNDSLLVGYLGHLFLSLPENQEVQLSPLALAGWAGLVINGLNCIPIGELDGGRIAFGVWGRRAASRIQVLTSIVLGLGGVIDTLALYWLLFSLFIQRGPIVPQEEELSPPNEDSRKLGAALLLLPLLTLLPYPAMSSSMQL